VTSPKVVEYYPPPSELSNQEITFKVQGLNPGAFKLRVNLYSPTWYFMMLLGLLLQSITAACTLGFWNATV
jgi:hypothetical protein